MNLNTGKEWSEMDLTDLRNAKRLNRWKRLSTFCVEMWMKSGLGTFSQECPEWEQFRTNRAAHKAYVPVGK
jgi:hypothetical protein